MKNNKYNLLEGELYIMVRGTIMILNHPWVKYQWFIFMEEVTNDLYITGIITNKYMNMHGMYYNKQPYTNNKGPINHGKKHLKYSM